MRNHPLTRKLRLPLRSCLPRSPRLLQELVGPPPPLIYFLVLRHLWVAASLPLVFHRRVLLWLWLRKWSLWPGLAAWTPKCPLDRRLSPLTLLLAGRQFNGTGELCDGDEESFMDFLSWGQSVG